MEALWGLVADELSKVETIGGQRYVDRHRKRGKMLARERIEQLVDADTPFLEFSPLAGWGSEFPIGAGVVMGIGIIEGVEHLQDWDIRAALAWGAKLFDVCTTSYHTIALHIETEVLCGR